MFDRLKEIANLERINITDDAITEIVNVSDGGLRDALGSLDKLVSYCDSNITLSEFEEINGIVDHVDRMQAMLDKGFRLEYFDIDHPTFKNNLLFSSSKSSCSR